jgi:hypothetical protein
VEAWAEGVKVEGFPLMFAQVRAVVIADDTCAAVWYPYDVIALVT